MVLVLEQPERFATLLRSHLEPWMNSDFSVYVGAIGQMFEDVYGLSADTGVDGDPGYVPGWGGLFDVDTCPAKYLPFLGQLVGVTNLVDAGETASRNAIRSQVAMHRGTPQAIINAAAATLTGTQRVVLTERWQNDPYQIRVITYTAETPSSAATLAAIGQVKPAGILVTYDVYSGWTIGAMETFYGAGTIATVEGAYATLAGLESQVAGV